MIKWSAETARLEAEILRLYQELQKMDRRLSAVEQALLELSANSKPRGRRQRV